MEKIQNQSPAAAGFCFVPLQEISCRGTKSAKNPAAAKRQ